MAQGLSGTLVFEFTTIDNHIKSKMRLSWSETYDISSNSSVFSINLVEAASPIWSSSWSRMSGDVMVNGSPMIQFRQSPQYGRVRILENMEYNTVKTNASDNINVTASMSIPHNADGSKTIAIEFLPTSADGYTYFAVTNGSTYESAFYMPKGQTANNPQYVTLTKIPKGLAKIYNGSYWQDHQCYIYNGSSWGMYAPYIWNGSQWVLYGGS